MDPTQDILLRGPVRLPPGSERITDADEEVFLLYSGLQASKSSEQSGFRGLGHVDSRKDSLNIQFDLKAPASAVIPPISSSPRASTKKSRISKPPPKIKDKSIEIELAQDKTALRSRKGDTGSVLWKASVDFAHFILQQDHNQVPDPLLSNLQNAHVLELGAGTGLLGIALSPMVKHYTVTDIQPLIPLIRKNLALNSDLLRKDAHASNVTAEELDWEVLYSTPHSRRSQIFTFEPIDLILVVDCIYHPSLFPSLIETLTYLAKPGQTAVLVVVELRAVDVIREFLDIWIASPSWEIWRVGGGESMTRTWDGNTLDLPYAMWLGWRSGGFELPQTHDFLASRYPIST